MSQDKISLCTGKRKKPNQKKDWELRCLWWKFLYLVDPIFLSFQEKLKWWNVCLCIHSVSPKNTTKTRPVRMYWCAFCSNGFRHRCRYQHHWWQAFDATVETPAGSLASRTAAPGFKSWLWFWFQLSVNSYSRRQQVMAQVFGPLPHTWRPGWIPDSWFWHSPLPFLPLAPCHGCCGHLGSDFVD